MTTYRKQQAVDLMHIANWFRQRVDGASKDSQERYHRMADVCEKAADTIMADDDTIRAYEEEFLRMEDDGK